MCYTLSLSMHCTCICGCLGVFGVVQVEVVAVLEYLLQLLVRCCWIAVVQFVVVMGVLVVVLVVVYIRGCSCLSWCSPWCLQLVFKLFKLLLHTILVPGVIVLALGLQVFKLLESYVQLLQLLLKWLLQITHGCWVDLWIDLGTHWEIYGHTIDLPLGHLGLSTCLPQRSRTMCNNH